VASGRLGKAGVEAMRDDIRDWRHVFKLDPDKTISDEHLEL